MTDKDGMEETEEYKHNLSVLGTLKPGDIVTFKGKSFQMYKHYAIYVGSGNIIDLTTDEKALRILASVKSKAGSCCCTSSRTSCGSSRCCCRSSRSCCGSSRCCCRSSRSCCGSPSNCSRSGNNSTETNSNCSQSSSLKGHITQTQLLEAGNEKNEKVDKNNFLDGERTPLPPKEIVERAKSKLGEVEYNLFSNNCEHFATWCRYGEAISRQVDDAKNGVGFGIAVNGAAAAVALRDITGI